MNLPKEVLIYLFSFEGINLKNCKLVCKAFCYASDEHLRLRCICISAETTANIFSTVSQSSLSKFSILDFTQHPFAVNIAKIFPHITKLLLSSIEKSKIDTLPSLWNALPNLKTLVFRGAKTEESGINDLVGNLPTTLEKLKISLVCLRKSRGFKRIHLKLKDQPLPTSLRSLYLRSTGCSLSSITYLTLLTKLQVYEHNMNNSLENSLRDLFHLKNLRCLHLERIAFVQDSGLSYISSLKRLSLVDSIPISSDFLSRRFPNLSILHINCKDISDIQFPNTIKSLSLSNAKINFSEQKFPPFLVNISLIYVQAVEDIVFYNLPTTLRRLRMVDHEVNPSSFLTLPNSELIVITVRNSFFYQRKITETESIVQKLTEQKRYLRLYLEFSLPTQNFSFSTFPVDS